jgi:hypothetical protein
MRRCRGDDLCNDDVQRPFIVTDGAMRYLGDVYGNALAVNAAGTVVGMQYGPVGWRIFIYAEGVFSGLEKRVDGLDGAQLVDARAIDDAEQIAGRACACSPDAASIGLRLDPVPARHHPERGPCRRGRRIERASALTKAT